MMDKRKLLRVHVAIHNKRGELVNRYFVNWNDRKERKVFGQQSEAALRAGYGVTTRPVINRPEQP